MEGPFSGAIIFREGSCCLDFGVSTIGEYWGSRGNHPPLKNYQRIEAVDKISYISLDLLSHFPQEPNNSRTNYHGDVPAAAGARRFIQLQTKREEKTWVCR